MRRKFLWRASVLAAFTFCGGLGFSTDEFGFPGVGPAEAKTFYTRKRVNGRWITGRFARKGATRQTVSRDPGPDAGPAVRSRNRVVASARGLAEETAMPPVDRARRSEPVLPLARGALAQAGSSAGAAAQANAAVDPAEEAARLLKLRQALQARASALTTETGPRPTPEAQSVSLDFKSGLKTTLFSDGTTVREPFDVAAMKALAASPPEARTGAR